MLFRSPPLVDITPSFEGGVEDEIAGVSRHLRKLKSTVTGEYLNPVISREAEARLEMAFDIMLEFLIPIVMENPLYLIEWSLPQKWGKTREVWWQRMVEKCCEVIEPRLTGFCKLCEIALPTSKLPRLVGSMGNLACAKSAAVWSSVEKLFCKFVPQCVIKGKTQAETASRLIAFARGAHRHNLQQIGRASCRERV